MRPRLIDRVNSIQPPYSPKKSQLPLRRCVFPRKIRVTRRVGVGESGGREGGRREEGLETLPLGLKAKTNSGRHGGCAIQSWCNGIPRTSGNWDDASRTKVNGFGSARNAMKFRVSPRRWKYREIVGRAGQHPRNVARYPMRCGTPAWQRQW